MKNNIINAFGDKFYVFLESILGRLHELKNYNNELIENLKTKLNDKIEYLDNLDYMCKLILYSC